jgi:N-acetylglucosamine malate deacetylase 2
MNQIRARSLPRIHSLLAVCAHPDDESFGLGAALAAFTDQGVRADVLCFTGGEASTLGPYVEDLARTRADELRSAANVLGVERVTLLDYADGALDRQPVGALAEEISLAEDRTRADLLFVMDTGGITGHPDHQRASESALVAADLLGIPVLAWVLHADVAEALRHEFDVPFVGRPLAEIDISFEVDRRRQIEAIHCHRSQSVDNAVLWRRLELQGPDENLRWLRRPDQ